MDILSGLLHGFQVATAPGALGMCVLGVVLGTVIGVLPGLGPSATIAMLLPLTMKLDPTGAMIMLAGIYYGAKYGGSTTSILLNVPGESSSVVTCIDGYQMARNGRAGPALGMAAISSFIAGTFGVVALMLVAPPLAELSLAFSSPEYFALMVMGLAMVVLLAGDSLVKALLAMLVGLWISGIGTDLFTATSRFTFGSVQLLGGIEFILVAIGVFAVGEVLANIEPHDAPKMLPVPKGIRNLLPTWDDMKRCRFAFVNGSVVGFIIGVLPGAGATIASFISYGIEKAVSRHPEEFGKGAIEGVAAPEGSNNAETGGALVPLLTLGIPGSGTTAILLAALVLWGFKPGPLFIHDQPQLFWGLVASMYIGNVVLLILNLPLVALFAQLLRVPAYVLQPLILGVSIVGVYASDASMFQLGLLALFGLGGYVMRKLDFPTAPLVLGLVLGDPMERALRQSLMMSQGHLSILVRPIPATLLVFAALLLAVPLFRKLNAIRMQMLESEEA
jgi:putative tricarboxylic transport membrane protein